MFGFGGGTAGGVAGTGGLMVEVEQAVRGRLVRRVGSGEGVTSSDEGDTDV